MKKSTPAASPYQSQRTVNQVAVSSVVTPLRAKRTRPQPASEPDIDLSALRVFIDELPTLNATKVVSLHRRIENGDYEIDADRIAAKMLELESALDRE